MIFYQYKCESCGEEMMGRWKIGKAPPGLPAACLVCDGDVYRVFRVGAIRTDTNSPLRGLGRMTGGDMSTRKAAAQTMADRGLVMANDRDCDGAERRARQHIRDVDAQVATAVRHYSSLPEPERLADARQVAKTEQSRAVVPATVLG